MRENEYKEILSALLGLLNEGVHIVAGQGTSIFYNSVMARMEQMEPADVVGRRFEDAFSHMDLESSTIYRALQAGASTVNQPQRYINASGKYIHTINTTIPVKDADGKLLAVIEVANDVTQLSELCDRLAHLQSQVGTQETSKKQKLKRYHFSDLIGRDPKFQKSMERAKRAAQNDIPGFPVAYLIRLLRYSGGTARALHPFPYYPARLGRQAPLHIILLSFSYYITEIRRKQSFLLPFAFSLAAAVTVSGPGADTSNGKNYF